MSFKLTPDFVKGLVDQASGGDMGPLIEAIDPEVKWMISSTQKDSVSKTGIYVSWN